MLRCESESNGSTAVIAQCAPREIQPLQLPGTSSFHKELQERRDGGILRKDARAHRARSVLQFLLFVSSAEATDAWVVAKRYARELLRALE